MFRRFLFLFSILLVVVACGGDDDTSLESSGSQPTDEPTAVPTVAATETSTPPPSVAEDISAEYVAQYGKGRAYDAVWTPDENLLIVGARGLWFFEDFDAEPTLYDDYRSPATISPDGTLVVSTNTAGDLVVWNLADGTPQVTVPLDSAVVDRLDFNSDGSQVVAVLAGNTVRAWDTTSGEVLHELDGVTVRDVAYRPDGTLIAMVFDFPQVELWDVAQGESYWSTELNVDPPDDVSPEFFREYKFTADGAMMVTLDVNFIEPRTAESWLTFWDTTTGEAVKEITEWQDYDIAFAQGGAYYATQNFMGAVVIYDLETGERLSRISPGFEFDITLREPPLRYARFSPAGEQVALVSNVGRILIYDSLSGELVTELTDFDRSVEGLAFVEGDLVAVYRDEFIRRWDIATDSLVTERRDPNARFHDVTYSSDRNVLGVGTEDVWLLDPQLEEVVDTLLGFDVFQEVAFHGELLAFVGVVQDFERDDEIYVRVWDLEADTLAIDDIRVDATQVGNLVFSPDGAMLAIAGPETLLIDLATGQTSQPFATESVYVDYSPDGSHLAAVDADGLVTIWDVGSEETVSSFSTNGSAVSVIRYHNGLIAVGGRFEDGVVGLWDATTGELISMLEAPVSDPITHMIINDEYIAGGTDTGIVMLWQLQ